MAEPKSLVRKLAEISGEIGRVPKNGYNSFHKYRYVLESDLVDHIRPLLAERNVMIIPRVGLNSHGEGYGEYAHDNDGEGLTTIVYEYQIVDGDSGESLITSAVGYGSDKGDKGAYKASTGAYKYMLMRLFQVATGDDPEGDERTDQRVAAPTRVMGIPTPPAIGSSAVPGIEKGGRSDKATTLQIRQVKLASQDLKLGPSGMRDLIELELGDAISLPDDEAAQNQVLSHYLEDMRGEDIGRLISALVKAKEALDATS